MTSHLHPASLAAAAALALLFEGGARAAGVGERSPYPVPPCSGTLEDPPGFDEFILGVQAGGQATTLLPELGLRWTRTYIAWNSIQPTIDDPDLTLDEAMNRPDVIEEYIAAMSWGSQDGYYRSLLGAGLEPFPVVGAGWYTSYPKLDGAPATPDALGKEAYIAQVYRHTRAVVERYDGDGYLDADGIVLKHWQVENELNQAWLTALWGWRLPAYAEGLTSSWYDWAFLTDLLTALDQAVHDADPDALTVTNLHTDVHEDINHLFRLPSWQDAAGLWRDRVDVMGFDAYPNYYRSDPIRGEMVGDRVALIREATCGRNVIAMEVGYPAGPVELGYSEEKQAYFLDEALHAARDAGASGYFYFKLDSSYQDDVEITPEDVEAVHRLAFFYDQGRVVLLTAWALANLTYIEEHLLAVLQSVEPYWGLVDQAGERKTSFFTMSALAEEIYGGSAEAP